MNTTVSVDRGRHSAGQIGGRPKLGRFHKMVIRIPRDIHASLQNNADDLGVSMNEVVNQRLRGLDEDRNSAALLIRRELERIGLLTTGSVLMSEQNETPTERELSRASASVEGHSKPAEGLNNAKHTKRGRR